ncbi:hypothetical protein [Pseudoduganella sp.]|uniref:hypothetical protein n=1 Tax=Pseudoduganella sp. TaxID=1880898 RepID=UPI0035B4E7B9
MSKALIAAGFCLLIAGCATEPEASNAGAPQPAQQQAAEKEERYEITGSHLRRKRQTDNMTVADREALERQGRPAANITLPPAGGR